jgi:hypothetical protein
VKIEVMGRVRCFGPKRRALRMKTLPRAWNRRA